MLAVVPSHFRTLSTVFLPKYIPRFDIDTLEFKQEYDSNRSMII